ncbi:hypothetical protein ACSNOK_26135 [Streptomyces sp. URMC 126]|uniref:hypothetical protein n=1 Tax=Streptomyces sp. URMC 126 TaxID=3423401 RepID=UPI003F19D28F
MQLGKRLAIGFAEETESPEEAPVTPEATVTAEADEARRAVASHVSEGAPREAVPAGR